MCYMICITAKEKQDSQEYLVDLWSCKAKDNSSGDNMHIDLIEIDFNSDEAIYMQLRNQIILGIATSRLHDGDVLPSVRQLADIIGINMHTVNKAYAVLRQEGIVSIDRRKGAVICIDSDKLFAMEELRRDLTIVLAKGRCRNITRQEAHQLIDEIYQEWDDSYVHS